MTNGHMICQQCLGMAEVVKIMNISTQVQEASSYIYRSVYYNMLAQ